MDLDVQERFLAALEEEIQKESDEVANDRATDIADYRRRCGRIRGLKRARDLLVQSVRQVLEDEEDDTDGTPSG